MSDLASVMYYALFALISTILIHGISKHSAGSSQYDAATHTINLSVILEFILILFVVLFCAFREIGEGGLGGTDAYAYLKQFEDSTGSLMEQLARFSGWEPLHTLSLWIVRKFTSEYRVYLVLYYIVMSCFLIKYAKMFRLNIRWFLATFGLMLYFISSFNTQRNTFAVFAGFYIVDFLLKRKYGKAIIGIIVLIGFHFSALILFVVLGAFLFIQYFRGSLRAKLIGYVTLSSLASIVLLFLFPRIVGGSRLSIYADSNSSLSIPMLLAFLFVMVVFLIYHREIITQIDSADIAALSVLYIAFAPMFIFQLRYAIMYRMMLYSIPVLYVLLARYIDYFVRKTGEMSLLSFACIVILIFRIIPTLFEGVDIGVYANVLL